MTARAYWLPPGCPVRLATETVEITRGDRRMTLEVPRPTPEDLRAIADHLRQARRRVLANRTVDEIVTSLDRTARLWLDPSYRPRLPDWRRP